VKAGKAIFHLGGKGRLAEQQLPASAVLKGAKDERGRPLRVLIVQAEVGANGLVTYGVVSRTSVGEISGKELSDFRTLPKK
jgi:hypothetical protein